VVPYEALESRKRNLVLDEERFEDTFLKCLICRENYDDGEKVILGQLMCPEMNGKMKDSPLVMEKSWFNV